MRNPHSNAYTASFLHAEIKTASAAGGTQLDWARFSRRRDVAQLLKNRGSDTVEFDEEELGLVASKNAPHDEAVNVFLHHQLNTVVGVALGGCFKEHGTSSLIFVHPEHRRGHPNTLKGSKPANNGRFLWKVQYDEFEKRKVKKVHVVVPNNNTDALTFWTKGCEFEPMENCILMERAVGKDEIFQPCLNLAELGSIQFGSLGLRGLITESSFTGAHVPTTTAVNHALMWIKGSGLLRAQAVVPASNTDAVELMRGAGFEDVRNQGKTPLQLLIQGS